MSVIEGPGLHGGVLGRVSLERSPGPLRLRQGGAVARLDELVPSGARRSTRVATADGRLVVDTVEHLFAALGAAGVRDGVVVEVDGPEVPLADGAARRFLDAVLALGAPPSPPALEIVRAGSVEVGGSFYEFLPGDATVIEVEIDFGDHRIARHATWAGDLADFRERVAPSRTFGFARELAALLGQGLASHVTPESVVVIDDERILAAGAPFTPGEPARHKLLDLVGDLYVHGGPPRGVVRASRPGHAATHAAVDEALGRGILQKVTAV